MHAFSIIKYILFFKPKRNDTSIHTHTQFILVVQQNEERFKRGKTHKNKQQIRMKKREKRNEYEDDDGDGDNTQQQK